MMTPQQAPPTSGSADPSRPIIYSLVVLLLLAGAGYYKYVLSASRPTPVNELEMIRTVAARAAQNRKLGESYRDADGDLVADAPSDSDKLQTVNEIGFSMVAGDDPVQAQEDWRDFLVALE